MAELSGRYANALYDIATQRDELDAFWESAIYARSTLEMEECRLLLANKLLSGAEKRDFLGAVFGQSINADMLSLFYLAVDKRREAFILPALDAFIEMCDSARRETTAGVVSAAPLEDGQVETLKGLLSRKLNKRVNIVTSVDPSLLGGIVIHVDGYLIDRTVKKKLSDLIFSMKRGNAG